MENERSETVRRQPLADDDEQEEEQPNPTVKRFSVITNDQDVLDRGQLNNIETASPLKLIEDHSLSKLLRRQSEPSLKHSLTLSGLSDDEIEDQSDDSESFGSFDDVGATDYDLAPSLYSGSISSSSSSSSSIQPSIPQVNQHFDTDRIPCIYTSVCPHNNSSHKEDFCHPSDPDFPAKSVGCTPENPECVSASVISTLLNTLEWQTLLDNLFRNVLDSSYLAQHRSCLAAALTHKDHRSETMLLHQLVRRFVANPRRNHKWVMVKLLLQALTAVNPSWSWALLHDDSQETVIDTLKVLIADKPRSDFEFTDRISKFLVNNSKTRLTR